VHYAFTHIVGTSGGNTDDIKESLALMEKGMDTSGLITHIGGLDAVPEATLNLPNIPGGKKLIYTHLEMPLAAITDFRKLGEENPLFIDLADICDHHDGLWSVEAEELLLKEG
ncbi:MAG: L-sorbose 1-phosphate reductase, partial [Bacteroidetes bacterium]